MFFSVIQTNSAEKGLLTRKPQLEQCFSSFQDNPSFLLPGMMFQSVLIFYSFTGNSL